MPTYGRVSFTLFVEYVMNVDVRIYVALSAVMFLEYAVWGAWAPVLAARLLGPLKMSGKQTGWIYATLPMACIVSPLVAGQLADRYLNVEWILAASHVAGAVLLFFAARSEKFTPLFVAMLLYSLFFAATLTQNRLLRHPRCVRRRMAN